MIETVDIYEGEKVTTLLPRLLFPPAPPLFILKGDEELAEYHFTSRTAGINNWPSFRHPCTPSVVRFYKEMRDKSGDFRVDISPMLQAYMDLNHEFSIEDNKTRYFFGSTTALFNTTGYPKQMYTTMQLNKLKGTILSNSWLKFETLTPQSNVTGMTHESHPWFIHRFDLVCYRDKQTYHKPSTPQGVIDYFLVTVEGFAFIPLRYVREA